MRAALLALAGCYGAHGWSTTDVALESTLALTVVADGLQSRAFVAGCREVNPIVGACGQRVPLAVYVPLVTLAHALVVWAIPRGNRRTAFLGLTTGIELDTVYSNTLLRHGH